MNKNIDNLIDLYTYLGTFRFESIDNVNYYIKNIISKIINYIIKYKKYLVIIRKYNYEYMNKNNFINVDILYYKNNKLEKLSLLDIITDENYIGRYNDITFEPYKTTDNFNMWLGINAKYIGNLCITYDTNKIINFIKNIICDNDINKFNYFINWLKNVIVKGQKTNKHIFLYSKSICLYDIEEYLNWIVDKIIGDHHAKNISSNNIKKELSKYNYNILYCLNIYKKSYKFIYEFLKKNQLYSNFIVITDNINKNIIDNNFILYEINEDFIIPNMLFDDNTANEFYTYISIFEN
ncbi:hypothetical protein CHBEV_328 [Choristoneura biennis entomopoxvirus]|uniref:Uncharacterized protein n=1 Tax=Choristoneura biennis entomopoxvirus TaxID=10288 RepID=A0A916KPZ0_CBEPV|nr:hypothetical protein CHBEV_007 [Choristoneura biennis entomopoxvirus]YP_008004398.1 hypothetical protein CHBEV_328 [Choristoneura biennis entomopoxvirus]CCU55575.1 hypothetical protein CHBEV_007 [Choristoneura biennis entomopoxvirus]CCU55896.1 hypothetical protein CHBEV_328 [Choristoneura biennis entomopoxvirus]